MSRIRIIKTGPMATIQDFGRFGYRRFGVPQSGAMDREWMIAANQLVGNSENCPVIEFAIQGLEFEVEESGLISVLGASMTSNGKKLTSTSVLANPGDSIVVSAPQHVYGYIGIEGVLQVGTDFESASTYLTAGFGGVEGRTLRRGDVLKSIGSGRKKNVTVPDRNRMDTMPIRIMKGPEWDFLKELPEEKLFAVDISSNRMGIRLKGSLNCDYREVPSSAVIPGTIQLPSNGQPIVLMNDCQTTGGYPRIGKVVDEDLGKLAQARAGSNIQFVLL